VLASLFVGRNDVKGGQTIRRTKEEGEKKYNGR